MIDHGDRRNRRQFLGIALAVPTALMAARAVTARGKATPTPACGDAGVTPPQTAGPYFKPNSPRRTSLLEPGLPGSPIAIEGRVLDAECRAIAGALLDFWQADDRGEYDNAGYRLRGHQFTDDRGRYRLETIVPGVYPGRARHVHVKVQAPGQPPLTTQLYFPGEVGNRRDVIFDPALVMKVRDVDGGKVGAFDFVLGVRVPGA